MIVEVKGVQFVNKGAELMLHAILDRVRAARPAASFTVAPNVSSCPYEKLAALGIYPKLWLQRYGIQWGYLGNKLPRRLVRAYGLKTDSEVDVVLDASGFAYGDQWSPRTTVAMARAVCRWRKQGTRVILLPQAFGPFSSKEIRKAFRVVASQADLIFARDPVSYKHIVDLVGQVPHLKQAPDFTVLLDGKAPSYFDGASQDVAIIPNQRMMDKTAGPVANRYIPFLATCAQEFLDRGHKPFFLIHEGRADEELARKVARLLQRDVPVVTEDDPRSIKGIIRECKAVVSSRYHGLISALSQGVPALGTGWSHKYHLLFEQYSCPDLLLSPETADEQVKVTVASFIKELEGRRRDLLEAAAQHKQATIEMWDHVFGVLGTGKWGAGNR